MNESTKAEEWRNSNAANEPDIFVDALVSQIDAIRRTAFEECIAIVQEFTVQNESALPQKAEKLDAIVRCKLAQSRDITAALEAARDRTEKPRSDKGKHHHVAGVLQK